MQLYRSSVPALWLGLGLLASPALAAPLSLVDHRFSVEATWTTGEGQTGAGTPVSLTDQTGYFWFFSPTNVEVVVKVLDACSGPAPRFWVFAGGLTNTEVTLTVTDEANGEKKVYRNPQSTPFQPIQDTNAFGTCSVEHCGQGTFADLAVSPRANRELETLAAVMAGTLVAPQAVYDRVVADVAAIQAVDPSLANIGFDPGYDLQGLFVELDEASLTALLNDNYHVWDCLNRRYGMRLTDTGNLNLLEFDRGLNVARLIEDYEALPGVVRALPWWEPQTFPGIPPEIIPVSFCGRIEGNLYRYYARRLDREIFYFTTLPGGAPVPSGVYSAGGPQPAWYADAAACFDAQELVDPFPT